MNYSKHQKQQNNNFSIKRRVKRKISKYEKDMFLDEFGYEKYYLKIKNLRKNL